MRRKRIIEAAELIGIFGAIAALVVYPKESVDAAKNGISLCLNAIVPSLFPFFVLSTLIVRTDVTRHLSRALGRVMRPLFNVGGSCSAAFVLGFVGGYPVGAKTVISLYENGSCTKTEAERLLSFCNNSGPAFIFGVVGAGVFGSGKVGLLLYLAHTAASVLVGVLFRFYGRSRAEDVRKPRTAKPMRFLPAFSESVGTAFTSTLNICGFVIFFTVLIKLLFISGALPWAARLVGELLAPFGMTAPWAERMLTGVIEISSGVWTLRGAEGQIASSVAMAAFMLGWAGLSVHSQVLSFIGESGLSVRTYIAGKLLQGAVSAAIIFGLGKLAAFGVPASALYAEEVYKLSEVTFFRAFVVSCVGSGVVFALLLGIVWFAYRRDMKRNGML
ncbi:MAG: sporulation protein [Oscillospiraceae bacterium]|jgi:sporulation integral membrane protein YlbJ|nr:sporulation protein [Oscillospiraceae bacterium]